MAPEIAAARRVDCLETTVAGCWRQ